MRNALLFALSAATVLLASACGSGHAQQTTDTNGCVPVQRPPLFARSAPRPTQALDPAHTYDVTIATNCGSFTIRLDPTRSPNAAESFASLVKSAYYDGTTIHHIVSSYFQGGDPTGTGTGGPGYTTVDKPAPGTKYTRGVVAMAKTGVQPPGTAGSQFFVVTTADAGLTADYAVVGTVVSGLDVVDRIAKLGGSDGTPSETVEIEHATLQTF